LDPPTFKYADHKTYEQILIKVIRRQRDTLNETKQARKEFIRDKTLKKNNRFATKLSWNK